MLSHTIKAGCAGVLTMVLLAAGAQAAPTVAGPDAARGLSIHASRLSEPVRHRHCYFVRRCGYYLNACRILQKCERRRHRH